MICSNAKSYEHRFFTIQNSSCSSRHDFSKYISNENFLREKFTKCHFFFYEKRKLLRPPNATCQVSPQNSCEGEIFRHFHDKNSAFIMSILSYS